MRKVWFSVIIGGILFSIAYVFRDTEPVANEREVVPVAAQGVGALGRIEPCSEVRSINAPSVLEPPVIGELLVSVGQQVAAGDVLAVLDSSARELADVEEARAVLLSAEATLAQVNAGAKAGDIAAQEAAVEQARRRLELAQQQLSRARQLAERKALSTDELDVRLTEVDVRQRELSEHEATLAAVKEIRVVDVDHAAAEVVRARAALKRAEADLAVTQIRSPIAGEVLRIHHRAGERIGSDGLLQLGDTSQMDVVAEVHESDILRVELEQRATIVLRNLDRTLQGTVIEIGRLIGRKDVLSDDPVDDADARVVEVRIRLDDVDGKLVSGLSYARAEVMIHTDVRMSTESTPPANSPNANALTSESTPTGAFDDGNASDSGSRKSSKVGSEIMESQPGAAL